MLEVQDLATRFSSVEAMSVGELAVLPAATLSNLKTQVEQVVEEAQRLDC